MKRYISPLAILAFVAVVGFSGLAWQQHARAEKKNLDTVPVRNDIRTRDLDKAMEELDKAKVQLHDELSKQDWSKVQQEIDKAMKEVDAAKIQADVQKALAEVDMEKIRTEVMAALDGIDKEKLRADVDAALASVDMEAIKKELQKVKEVDMEKVKKELEKIKPEIEKSMQDAKLQIEKAKEEIRGYKTLINDLETEGYLKKGEPYDIEHKDGTLTVNGKTVSDSFYQQHKTFLEKHKKFTLKNQDRDSELNIQ
ncbi:MAG: hypothetical protein ACO1OO_09935 [Flavisolibacter sp.]